MQVYHLVVIASKLSFKLRWLIGDTTVRLTVYGTPRTNSNENGRAQFRTNASIAIVGPLPHDDNNDDVATKLVVKLE